MKKPIRGIDEENTDRWLMTYADLITLLLAFFVVMYSMSRIDAKRFGKMSERLQGLFRGAESVIEQNAEESDLGSGVLKVGKLKLIASRLKQPPLSVPFDRVNVGLQTNSLLSGDSTASHQSYASSQPLSIELNERGLVIHILESTLFQPGQATIRPAAMQTLDKIAVEIKNLPNQIRVEGHTDNLPIATVRYPSNWELSSARATAVVRYLVDKHAIDAARLSALGFGEFRPLAANDTEANRSKNRRIDIVVLTENLSRLEPGTSDSVASRNILQANLENNSER